MRDVIAIDELTDESYSLLINKLPDFITFDMKKLFWKLILAVPVDVGRITDVAGLMEQTLYMYGDMECPMDYEAMGVVTAGKERLEEHLQKHATDPEEAMRRIMRDIIEALKAVSDRIIELMTEHLVPVVSDVGAVYRFHKIDKGNVLLKLLDWTEITTIAGQ